MTTLAAELITREPELAALRPEWAALHRRAGTSPFQSPEWLLPWWRSFGTGELRAAALRSEDGALAGLLPLYVLREAGGAKLLPVGVGVSDFLDALVEPGLPDAASALLSAALDGMAGRVSACDLPDMPPAAHLLAAAVPDGWAGRTGVGTPCPVLPLAGGLRARAPARMLRKWRMAMHRADRAGGWSVEPARADTLMPIFGALVALHGGRWATRGEAGVLADPDVREFHRAALPGLMQAGLLRLQALRIGGEIAAVTYALLGPGRIFFYLSGFDPDRAFESPGTILLGAMLAEAAAEGREQAEFLRGAEAYKYAWGAADRFNHFRRLVS